MPAPSKPGDAPAARSSDEVLSETIVDSPASLTDLVTGGSPATEQAAGGLSATVKLIASPPTPALPATGSVTGSSPTSPPTKSGLALLALLEYGVYIFAGGLVLAAIIVNYGVENRWWGNLALMLFSADANFLLAVGAILVIAFELRKERHGK